MTRTTNRSGDEELSLPAPRRPFARYEPTPYRIVNLMLTLAEVGPEDVLYDLGSGDGRIPITAATEFGARAVGIEIDAKRVALARTNAFKAGVSERVTFIQQDLFEADFSAASIVTLYLLPRMNQLLRPRLLCELRPGTRIVSHTHSMGTWRPRRTRQIVDGLGWCHRVYLWTVGDAGRASMPRSPGRRSE